MSVPTPESLSAKAEADRARARFMNTLGEVQERLAPATIARNAWEGVRERGEEVAGHTISLAREKGGQAVELARERPAAAGAAAGLLAVFVIRKPIAAGFRRLFRRRRPAPSSAPLTPPDYLGGIAARAGD